MAVFEIKIRGRKLVESNLKRIKVDIPKAGRNMTRNLSIFASQRAKSYAGSFSASGTLMESIRPQVTKDGWKVIVEKPAGYYAADMEHGFTKPRYLTRDMVSYAGYTVGDWMDARNLPSSLKGIWVGRGKGKSGKGMPKRGYKYMQRAFQDAVNSPPAEKRREMSKEI